MSESHYPRRKFSENDGGELGIRIFVKEKNVLLDFRKDVSWIGLNKFQALELAKVLIEKANSIDTGTMQ